MNALVWVLAIGAAAGGAWLIYDYFRRQREMERVRLLSQSVGFRIIGANPGLLFGQV